MLSEEALEAMEDGRNTLLLSSASVWEAAIKSAAGRLDLPESFAYAAEAAGMEELPICFEHAIRAAELPPLHRDPFDRILVAQAQQHDLTLLTVDDTVKAYPVKIFRA